MPDFAVMFTPTVAIGEIVARATIMYLFLFFTLRFLLKREGGALNLADLLVVVAVVDGAQPAFNGDAKSITESVLFVLTIIFWSYLLNWASFRFPRLTFLTAARPMPLVKDGEPQRANLRRALMTDAELDQQLREAGIGSLDEVRLAMLEGDGTVSVVPDEGADAREGGRSNAPAAL